MHSLAIPATNLNQGYSTPRDTAQENRNSLYYPLFEITKDLFLIPPRCLAARALYERLYALMRQAGPRNKKQDGERENKIARTLENLAAQAIRLAGHVPVGGKYVDPDTRKEYDVDLAVETAERVFLIECKKKALTNKARAGMTLDAIGDLTASLLDMLVQLSQHERVLRSHGRIVFKDGRILSLDGRQVERIAVTPLDYGSLQDRIFIGSLVRILLGSQLTSADPTVEKQLSAANKTIAALSANLTALADMTSTNPDERRNAVREFTISTWWLSVDQLQFLCAEAPDLWEALRSLRHVTSRSGDLMTEIKNLAKIKGKAKTSGN